MAPIGPNEIFIFGGGFEDFCRGQYKMGNRGDGYILNVENLTLEKVIDEEMTEYFF